MFAPPEGGHAGSELAGVIFRAATFDNVVVAEGVLDTSIEPGAAAVHLISNRILQTWSPDLGNPIMKEPAASDKQPKSDILIHAVFTGGTIVPFPSLDSAVIELFDLKTGEVIVPAPVREGQLVGSLTYVPGEGLTYSLSNAWVGEAGRELFIPKVSGTIMKMPTFTSTFNPAIETIVAHSEPTAPPASHFSDPGFTQLERFVTITEDGRFMTHIAGWGDCHVGYGDMCVTAPREADYSHFAVGTTLTSDGSSVPTGVIAIKGGHADISLDASSARSHYDDTSFGAVDVVIGTDDFGIWASGSLRPGTTPEQVRILRASGVSGDWRRIDGKLRLVGICCVNVPGFPKLSIAASADGITALVAAGGPPVPHPDLCDCKDSTQDILDELDSIHRLLADALIEEKAIDNLSARIMDEHEIETLYSRIAS